MMAHLYLMLLTALIVYRCNGNPPACQICLCSGDQVDCTNLNLTDVPSSIPIHTTVANFSNNKIQAIDELSLSYLSNLKKLDLSENVLSKLGLNSFKRMYSLQELDLSGMKMYLNNTGELFNDLKSLKRLKIDHIAFTKDKNDIKYPDKALQPLQSLEELWIDGFNATFGEGFRNLTKLKRLYIHGHEANNVLFLNTFCWIPEVTKSTFSNCSSVVRLELTECSIKRIQPGAFSTLPNLEELDLSGNELTFIAHDTFEGCLLLTKLRLCRSVIKDIEPNAFSFLNRLHTLDLSGNMYLQMENSSKIFPGLKNTSISVLKLNSIYHPEGIGITVQTKHFKHLQYLNLTEFHFDTNKVEIVEKGVLEVLPTTLQLISARENQFKSGNFYFDTYRLINLKVLDISYQYFTRNRKRRSITKKVNQPRRRYTANYLQCRPHRNTFAITLPPNLTYVDVSHSKISQLLKGFNVQSENSITSINASSSLIYKWAGPIRGLEKIQYLDLSNNLCKCVDENFFSEMPSLKYLRLSNNYLGSVLSREESINIFKSLTNVIQLDLSFNMLERVASSTFRNQIKLEVFNLSNNGLEELSIDLTQMRSLRYLDLSRNQIMTLNHNIRSSLDNIANPRTEHSLNVMLGGNPLQCSCQRLAFLRWLMDTKVVVHRTACQFPNGTRADIHNIESVQNLLDILQRECQSKILWILGTSFCILFAVLVIVAGLLYRFRWKLRYLYYSSNSAYGKSDRPPNLHLGYEALETSVRCNQRTFDAYICFDEDEYRSFVESMVEKLEKENGLKLCIPDRDLTAGKYIHKCIVSAIQLSRKTVFLMSKQFWSNEWCVFAMEMARQESIRTNRNVALAVLMESGQYHNDKIKDIIHIEYPYNQRREALSNFWNNLNDEIKEKATE